LKKKGKWNITASKGKRNGIRMEDEEHIEKEELGQE
jgi:hypothetical protein